MKILIVTWGTEGDTRPVLALAKGLLDAGHEPLVIADRQGEALARSLGIGFEAAPGDFRELMSGQSATGTMVRGSRTTAMAWPELVREFARPMLARVLERLDEGFDLLIGSSMGKIPAEVIARRRGVPTVGIDLQPFTPTREFPPPLLNVSAPAALNLPLYGAMNAAFGAIRAGFLNRMIPRVPHAASQPVPQLGAWSPTLVPRPKEWPQHKPIVLGELVLAGSPYPLDPRLEAFIDAGEPPVYLGLGSMAGVDLRTFRRTAIEALDGLRAVFSAGWNDFTDEDLPDTILPIGPAPLDWLFPRCDVIVHHAGAGTAHLAARSGRPSVCFPQIADQAFWANQFHRLGIAPPPLDRDSVTGEQLRTAITAAQSLVPRAQQVAEAMAHEDGVATTVAWIEAHHSSVA